MTPTEYRSFCESTYCAPPNVNREEYLRLLLIEEVGEVASLFAKALRDGHEVDRGRLLKELGDVLWASEMIANMDFMPHMREWRTAPASNQMSFSDLISSVTDYDGPLDAAHHLCLACGFTPEDVALANVAKLRDRQARGVLHGAGDER